MKEKALSADEVMHILEETRKRDYSYDRFFSTMCTQPHPIAVRAHDMFLETNLGDPGLFPGVADLEQRVVQMLGEMLGCPNAAGYVSTGGTESNIQAIRAARNEAGKKNGNIVVPESAHFSFDKIGDLLCLEVRKAELDESLKVDIASVQSQVDDNTVALVGIAGTTEFGQVDPIEDLAKRELPEPRSLARSTRLRIWRRLQRIAVFTFMSTQPSAALSCPFWRATGGGTSGCRASLPSPSIPTRWA